MRPAARGGSLPVVLNAANEEAVALFLRGRIGFTDIPRIVDACMTRHVASGTMQEPDFDAIMELDFRTRKQAREEGGIPE